MSVLFQTTGWGKEGANNWKVEPGKQHILSKKQRRRKELSLETKRIGKKEGA